MTDVNADRSFASEINTTGFVICKGNNENGELEVPFNSAYDYNGLALGLNHSCAIRRANQTVMCLGQNSEFSSSVVGGDPFESIVSGSDFTCGLRTSKFLVVCWGPVGRIIHILKRPSFFTRTFFRHRVKGTDSGQTDRHRGRLLPLQVFIDLAFLPRKNPIPDEEEL
nr:putative serine/threonine-protein kinase-like protein CCR3 [Ipomoea batatas]